MTTHAHSRPAGATPTGWVTLRRTVTSELIKLATLHSHVWLLVVATLFTAVLGPIQSIGQVVGPSPGVAPAGSVSLALAGVTTATLLVGVLGVLVVAGEYAPRAIRSTFTLVPRRGHVVVAKAVALGLVTAATTAVAVVVAVLASLVVLSRAGIELDWGSPQFLRVAAATVWYAAGWAVLGLAAGWVTRSKLGGAALLLGVMLVLAPVLGLVPGRAGEVLVALLPSSAGAAMIGTHPAGTLGTPVVGLAVWTTYLVVLTALSVWVVSRRDA